MDEMEDIDPEHWLPEHTLHLFVDPMLRALEWEPSYPAECRLFSCGTRLAGYSLSPNLSDSPALAVLAVPPGVSLAESASRAWPDPETVPAGVTALTDGSRWRIYHRGRLEVEVDITRMRWGSAAGALTEWPGPGQLRLTFVRLAGPLMAGEIGRRRTSTVAGLLTGVPSGVIPAPGGSARPPGRQTAGSERSTGPLSFRQLSLPGLSPVRDDFSAGSDDPVRICLLRFCDRLPHDLFHESHGLRH